MRLRRSEGDCLFQCERRCGYLRCSRSNLSFQGKHVDSCYNSDCRWGYTLCTAQTKRPQQQVSNERIQLTKDRAARQLADIATSIERQGADTRSTLEHKEFVLEILYRQRAMIQRIYDDCDRVQRDRRTGKQ